MSPTHDDTEVPTGLSVDLKKKVTVAAAWSVGARWGNRLLGLISTVILARLLDPVDFGLVAMAGVFAGIVTAFTQLELNIALVRLETLDKGHFNTAWTIAVAAGIIAGAGVMLLAPLAGNYYGDSRVTGILMLIGIAPMLSGLASPRVVLLSKHFHFNRAFQLEMLAKATGVAVTIPLALWLRDYRALVYGLIANAAIKVIFSYVFAPYLPMPSLARRRELVSVSSWLLVRNVAQVAFARAEQFVLGAAVGPEKTSYYFMGTEIGRMITGEIAQPLGRALLPGLSAAQNDSERMKRGILYALTGVVLALPFGFGMAALAPEFIVVVLGAKWLPATGVLQIISIGSAIAALGSAFGPSIMVRGQVKQLALANITGAVLILVVANHLSAFGSLEVIALARAAIEIALLIYFIRLAMRPWQSELRNVLLIISRPLLSAIVMYGVVRTGQSQLAFPPLWALVFWPPIGGATFVAVLFTTWHLSGRPFGIERFAVNFLLGLKAKRWA